jgi:hypothetical protein
MSLYNHDLRCPSCESDVTAQLLLENWVFDLTSHRVRKRSVNEIEGEGRDTVTNYTPEKERRSIMTNFIKVTLLSATLAALLLPAGAQTTAAPAQTSATPAQTTSPVQTTHPETIGQRKENQQDRIANGIDNGSLTAGEAGNLEKRESNLNQEEKTMKAEDNGHLTAADRTALQQQQNKLSNQIRQDKHNSNVQSSDPATREGKRAEKQQDRIGNGVKDGQLSANQASKLETKEADIHQEVKEDRAANGGKLTKAERTQVNKQQNGVSYQIHHERHNKKKP